MAKSDKKASAQEDQTRPSTKMEESPKEQIAQAREEERKAQEEEQKQREKELKEAAPPKSSPNTAQKERSDAEDQVLKTQVEAGYREKPEKN